MAPTIALLAFAFGAAVAGLLLWPRRGLLHRYMRRGLSDGELGEDILKHLLHRRPDDLTAISHALGITPERTRQLLVRLADARLLTLDGDRAALADAGRVRAIQLVRAHRLWERYLADRTGLAEEDWHAEAERQEHRLTPTETERLAVRMGRPLYDPHGDPIPESDDELPELDGFPLSALGAGQAEIVHLEDEPAGTYKRLVAAGLAPGQRLDVLAGGPEVHIALEGHEVVLTSDDAEAVTVRPVEPAPAVPVRPLDALHPGESARVVALTPLLRGPQRRRLLDLGLVPGTMVTAEMSSALGDPIAYRVRGALIALRREQAHAVSVEAA